MRVIVTVMVCPSRVKFSVDGFTVAVTPGTEIVVWRARLHGRNLPGHRAGGSLWRGCSRRRNLESWLLNRLVGWWRLAHDDLDPLELLDFDVAGGRHRLTQGPNQVHGAVGDRGRAKQDVLQIADR